MLRRMRAAGWRAVLALPFQVLVVIPAALLWLTRGARSPLSPAGPAEPAFWAALACFAAGLSLMVATIRLFDRRGQGTLAPWDPPRRLVVAGPYRRVRNPMISGVLLNLLGEALLFRSAALGAWLAVFFVSNNLYFVLSEEPALERRFGDEYRRYRAAVPRWIPRLRPWQPPT
jgi:protein-S-isoprenylcysteine O-methyltransferase Ste14